MAACRVNQGTRGTVAGAVAGLVLAVASLQAAAGDAVWLGAWQGSDRATLARYGVLRLTPTEVRWSGSAAARPCRTRYTARTTPEQVGYADRLRVPGEGATAVRYRVLTLTLAPAACLGGRTALRLAVPVDDPTRAELVGYGPQGRPVAWGHLQRLPSAPTP